MSGAATFSEHMRQAEAAWRKLHDGLCGVPNFALAEIREEVRRDAQRFFWLYPLIEARRGLP